MSTVHSPTVGRRRLRHALRRARDTAGLTQEQVAAAMDWSLSKVIRIENGAVSISTNDLRQLLHYYRVDDPDRVTELIELARVGRRRPWWTGYKDSLPAEYLSYIGLEDESSALRCFCPTGMPGLLQTEEFAHAVVAASWWASVEEELPDPLPEPPPALAARVDVRLARQRELLPRAGPPEITAVLDEAVLRREIGGTEVLRRQLRHLISVGQRSHITVRVLPFTANVVSMLSPFVIMEFPDPADPDVVYAESAFEQSVLDGDRVTAYRRIFTRLRDASLAEPESTALISRIADSL